MIVVPLTFPAPLREAVSGGHLCVCPRTRQRRVVAQIPDSALAAVLAALSPSDRARIGEYLPVPIAAPSPRRWTRPGGAVLFRLK